MPMSIIAVKFFGQLVHMNTLEEEALNTTLLEYTDKKKVGDLCEEGALNKQFRQRKSWDAFQSGLTVCQ